MPQSNRAVCFFPIRRLPSLVLCAMQLMYLFISLIIQGLGGNDYTATEKYGKKDFK
jgi:hypothetical protein